MAVLRKFAFGSLILLPACWLRICEPARPPRVFEETYLPFKQPNRDPSYPKMSIVRDDGDRYFEMNRGSAYAWGQRHTVQITATYNSFTQFTDRRAKLLRSEEAVQGEFRLHGISRPYFGEDQRTLLDGKAFVCSPELCKLLDARLEATSKFDLVMTFGETSSDALQLEAVEDPTCYNYLDCTVRQECCDRGGEHGVCEAHETCPKDLRIGLD